MDCPTCGGEAYNNTTLNQTRAREGKKPMPLFACKDKAGCGWVQWPPKTGGAPRAGGGGGARPAASQSAKWASYEALSVAYGKAVDIGYKHAARVAKGAGIPLTLDGILAASATVFIEASRGGVQAEPTRLPEGLDDGDGDY